MTEIRAESCDLHLLYDISGVILNVRKLFAAMT